METRNRTTPAGDLDVLRVLQLILASAVLATSRLLYDIVGYNWPLFLGKTSGRLVPGASCISASSTSWGILLH